MYIEPFTGACIESFSKLNMYILYNEPFTKLHCVHTGVCIEHLKAVNIIVYCVHWALYKGMHWALFKTQHVHFVQCTIYIEPFTKFHRVHTGACIEHLKAVNIIVHCVHWALYKGMHWVLFKIQHVHFVQCTIYIEPFTKFHRVHKGACIEHSKAVNIIVHHVHWAFYRGMHCVLFKTQHVHFVQWALKGFTGASIESFSKLNMYIL